MLRQSLKSGQWPAKRADSWTECSYGEKLCALEPQCELLWKAKHIFSISLFLPSPFLSPRLARLVGFSLFTLQLFKLIRCLTQ